MRRRCLKIKRKIRTPFFEVEVKNYVYGDAVIEMGKFLDGLSVKYDVDILYIVPYMEMRDVARSTERLIILAPYMDDLRPGRGMGYVLPEGLKAAGAVGVLMNHSEKPMSISAVKRTIDRANELDMLSFICADTIAEARAIAQLSPDIMNPEPNDRIGSGVASDMSYVMDTIREIKAINPDILVEQAAGITRGDQVYDFLMAGSEGAGAGSGIFTAKNPMAAADEMIAAVKRAREDLLKNNF
jgi:triosephosphate isomerase